MDSELLLDPMWARLGVAHLQEAGQTLTTGRVDRGRDLEENGGAGPWGADALGRAFQSNYDQIAPIVLEAWSGIATYVETYAAGVTSAIDAVVAAEIAADRRMTW